MSNLEDHTPDTSIAPPLDAFTDSVLRRLEPQIRASLTEAQLAAITAAVSASRPLSRHPVDVRGVIPLFWARYYVVFLMGRDRRHSTLRIEVERRQRSIVAVGVAFLGLALIPPMLLGFLLLYVIKCLCGIDIFPDKHLIDFIPH